MGAALTYARRYALFALVGIAGEDDLDAPDLQASTSATGAEPVTTNGGGGLNAAHHPFPTETTPRREAKPKLPTASPILGLHASAKLREQLLSEVKDLGSGEDAANWAHQNLAAKHRRGGVLLNAVANGILQSTCHFPIPVSSEVIPATIEYKDANWPRGSCGGPAPV